MVQIPENQVTQQDMERWYVVSDQLTKLKNEEQLLRQKIFKGMFHDPKEGTNSVDLADGYVLKGKRVINRTVDDAAFKASIEELAKNGIPTDEIVKYKPELVTSAYRKLTAEQINLFDTVLIVKDGMPGLEIVKPKRVKG
jgi:hypothetical protein